VGLRATEGPLLETDWSDLSMVERALLWPGIVTFFLTLLALTFLEAR
jgi:hypothetical protein